MKKRKPRLCLVSSSGGHWEQLVKLQPLIDKYDGFYVTERTRYKTKAKYHLIQTDKKDMWMPVKMLVNAIKAFYIWIKQRPDYVITTGTMVAYPFYLLSIIFRKKFVFIESFNFAYETTVAARVMQKHADLMIVQWESMVPLLKNAVYGGCLY